MLFVTHTTCHQRRLGGVETTNRSTSDGDEHHWEDRIRFVLRAETIPHFGQFGILHIKHHEDAHRHKEQGNGKERINLTDNLIDGHQGRQYIIKEDDDNPEIGVHPVGSHTGNQLGRATHEDRSHENHQNHSKDGHHLLGGHT